MRGRPSPATHQRQATRAQLLAAGARVVGELGFHGASVDQVVTEAGLARGTFYKYFRDKLDLVHVLAEACLEELAAAVASIPAAGGPRAGAALRTWLEGYDALHRRYAGVFRVWSEETPSDEVLDRTGREAVRLARTAVEAYLGGVGRTYPFDGYAASLMVLGLLERFPEHAAGSDVQPDRGAALELLAVFVERGLLNPGTPGRRQAPAAGRQ